MALDTSAATSQIDNQTNTDVNTTTLTGLVTQATTDIASEPNITVNGEEATVTNVQPVVIIVGK